MSRIALVDQRNANAEQKVLLDAIQLRFGAVPNYLRVLVNSPAALRAFLGLHGVASNGSLSAHTLLGRKAGLTGDEMSANRAGSSEDAKAAVFVKLARSLSEHRGVIRNAEPFEAREVGHSEADIVEIIVHVGMNLVTALIGNASHVEIDFPKVSLSGV